MKTAKAVEPMCASCGRRVLDDLSGHVESERDAGHRIMPYNAADSYRDSMSGTTLPLRGGMVGDRRSRTTVVVPMIEHRTVTGTNGRRYSVRVRHR